MTIPSNYLYADRDFRAFMVRAKETTEHETTNMVWGTLLGVFEVFRRRLDNGQRLAFAAVLPATLRAVFVESGPVDRPIAFEPRERLIREVQGVHRDHQFATDTAIDDIALALGDFVDRKRLEEVLAAIGDEARQFWRAALAGG